MSYNSGLMALNRLYKLQVDESQSHSAKLSSTMSYEMRKAIQKINKAAQIE